MIRFAQSNGSQRRSFRLSPLETLILGLVVVGALYLLTIWVTSFFPSSPQAPAASHSDQSSRAMVDAEKALVRANALSKELTALNKKIDLIGSSGGGKGKVVVSDAKLAARVDALEKKLDDPLRRLAALEARIKEMGDESAQAKKNSGTAVSPANLEPRLKRLEKELQRIESAPPAPDPRMISRLDGLDEKISAASPALTSAEARIKRIEKELAHAKNKPDNAAVASLKPRLDKLEKQMQAMGSKSTASNPGLSVRVDDLGKKLDGELKSLEGKVKKLEQSQALNKKRPDTGVMVALLEPRLKRMENQLKVLGSTSAANQSTLAERVGVLEKPRPSTEIASLNEKIEKIQAELDKRKDEGGVNALDLRLRRLEKEILKTRQSLLRVHAPLPDPELATRVENLEKQMGGSSSQGQLEKQLRELSAQVQALARSSKDIAQASPKPAAKTKVEKPPTPAPKREPSRKRISYKVRRGDTLFALARRYDVSVQDIRDWNPQLKRRRYLWVGETLVIYPEK